jgi:rhamnose utilization protein RhaD (predicted bifunctional aldolase and dehydrogenase)
MKSRWDDAEAADFPGSLEERVYSPRLLGRDPSARDRGKTPPRAS